MDDTETVFGALHLRASATHSGVLTDRISVRDYLRLAEIGAFASERGVEQRLRFNVVLEVMQHAAAVADDVDQVVSYDTITSAIDRILDAERLDLLETLAERIARGCLADIRVLRAFVRVEKLDRIPGALGVEIVRSQIGAETPRLHARAPEPDAPPSHADVLFLGRDALDGPRAAAWLDAVVTCSRPVIICIGADQPVAAARSNKSRRIGYLEIEQAALALADRDARFEVVASRTELDWAIEAGLHPIWAPARMIEAARDPAAPDASRPVALAEWLSRRLDGRLLIASADAAADLPEDAGALRLDPAHPGLPLP